MLEFLYGCPVLQTLTAVEEVVTLSISYDEMKDLLQDQADSDLNFMKMTKSVRIHLIRESHPSLKTLSESDLDILLASARTQTYEKYETICRKGESMHDLIILEQGQCIEYNGCADTLMELDQGEGVQQAKPLTYSQYYKMWEMCKYESKQSPEITYNTEVECAEYTRPGETFGTSDIVSQRGPPAPFTIV